MNSNRLRLPIRTPCHEDWSAMVGDAGERFCGACGKHVHDVSAMTESAARAMLAAQGRVCVRYEIDGDGEIVFVNETVEAPSLWRMTLAAAGLALALMSGCTDAEPDQINRDECVYDVGLWTVTTARGEGTCPGLVVGESESYGVTEPIMIQPCQPKPAVEPEPEPTVEPEPDRRKKTREKPYELIGDLEVKLGYPEPYVQSELEKLEELYRRERLLELEKRAAFAGEPAPDPILDE